MRKYITITNEDILWAIIGLIIFYPTLSIIHAINHIPVIGKIDCGNCFWGVLGMLIWAAIFLILFIWFICSLLDGTIEIEFKIPLWKDKYAMTEEEKEMFEEWLRERQN